jgi:hypothetical protein
VNGSSIRSLLRSTYRGITCAVALGNDEQVPVRSRVLALPYAWVFVLDAISETLTTWLRSWPTANGHRPLIGPPRAATVSQLSP